MTPPLKKLIGGGGTHELICLNYLFFFMLLSQIKFNTLLRVGHRLGYV